jgi:HK97 family phage major capsid protein
MECCGTLNELSLTFNDAEVDCFKVGGYFKVCNAVLEDSDLNLASELLTASGQAIGFALDKAILYGRNASGTQKMPMGIMSRLVQTEAPSGYPATARQWVDLHTSNIITIDDAVTGISLFQQILIASGAAKGKYARGPKTWVMNETTYTYLKAQAMSVNAAGAIVSGLEGSMPVVGGVVEVLDFIPDNVIIGGYFELYLLAERAGTKFAQSEHAFFVQDQTAFKGTARYDGQPVIPEGFVAIGLNDVTPSATMSFAPDTVNP